MTNIFRIAGDLTHCVAIFILINQILQSRSVSGLSFKTQLIYFIVYVARYSDFFSLAKWGLYNTVLKIVFITTSGYCLYLMQVKFRNTYNPNLDVFKIRYLLGGAAVLAILVPLRYQLFEIIWAFSIWLESVAILPQLFMIQRAGKAETLTTHYVFAIGLYRALYIPNWIYRWLWTTTKVDWISVVGGLIQTGLYTDFFYVYYTKVFKGQEFTLPV